MTLVGAQLEPAAAGHGVAGVDREIHDHLLELRNVDLHRPQIAAVHHVQRDLFADQPPQQHVEIGQHLAEIEHLRPHRLLAREGQQMPHQARRPVGVLLDLHDVLERRIGRLVGVEQEIGRHHDGGQHVVEIVGDAAGELADQLHLLRLRDLGLELALRRGLERIDDGGFLVALGLLDRGDIEAAEALARPGQHRIDRRDIGFAGRGGRMAASSAGRSRSATMARIERSSPSPLPAPWNSRANSGLVRMTPPCLSMVAIAIGV